jgi:hypothetical protein
MPPFNFVKIIFQHFFHLEAPEVVFSTYVSLFRNKYQILIKLTLSMHVRNYVQLIKAFLCLMVARFPDGWLVHGLCGVDTATRRLVHQDTE